MTGSTAAEVTAILATDCGSTTTKAILIEKVGGEYRQTFRGEAPTTVEAPVEDVTRGVLNAIPEVEELSGREILAGGSLLPIVCAGNKDARGQIQEILGDRTALVIADNIRPVLERENLSPARHMIHDLFLEHVMAQAPGYGTLIGWTGAPVMPTPAAAGPIMEKGGAQQRV